AAGAEEIDAESVLMFDRDSVGINKFCAALGISGGRKHFDRPAAIHAESPLSDVQVVRTPIAYGAAAVFHIIAPCRKTLVNAARAEDGAITAKRSGPA